METKQAAAPVVNVHLNGEWENKYRQRVQKLHRTNQSNDNKIIVNGMNDPLFTLCLVGRCGVGKGSLVNHLLQRRAAKVCEGHHDTEEHVFNFLAMFSVRELPGYNGYHMAHRKRHFEMFRSKCGKAQKLTLDEFVEVYGLFGEQTHGLIFVVDNTVTEDDSRLIKMAIENRKFLCIVRTHSDHVAKIADPDLRRQQLYDMENQLREKLSLTQHTNIKIFIVSTPLPNANQCNVAFDEHVLQVVVKNVENLQFPDFKAYLTERNGYYDELYIHRFVQEEVLRALEDCRTCKKRHQALDFTEQLLASVLFPIGGPIMVSFTKTLCQVIIASSSVGLVENPKGVIERLNNVAKRQPLSLKMATKEGLATAFHDSLIHIFGKDVFTILLEEVLLVAAEESLLDLVPVLGPTISAATLPKRSRRIADKLAIKACLLHELWVMQNLNTLLK